MTNIPLRLENGIMKRSGNSRARPSPLWLAHLFVITLVMTLLNAIKPLHIDDIVYYLYAMQATVHPLSPYDFEILWLQLPDTAQNPIAPPVVPYWLAAAI